MAGSLRAKFQVWEVTQRIGVQEVALTAVYGKDGTANQQWSKATPAGKLTMTITNEAAWDHFKPGDYVWLDLTEAPEDA